MGTPDLLAAAAVVATAQGVVDAALARLSESADVDDLDLQLAFLGTFPATSDHTRVLCQVVWRSFATKFTEPMQRSKAFCHKALTGYMCGRKGVSLCTMCSLGLHESLCKLPNNMCSRHDDMEIG